MRNNQIVKILGGSWFIRKKLWRNCENQLFKIWYDATVLQVRIFSNIWEITRQRASRLGRMGLGWAGPVHHKYRLNVYKNIFRSISHIGKIITSQDITLFDIPLMPVEWSFRLWDRSTSLRISGNSTLKILKLKNIAISQAMWILFVQRSNISF